MIDLSYSRDRMLADLGVRGAPDVVVREPDAPEFLEGNARLEMSVHRPDEALPRLRETFEHRFSGVAERDLERNLLSPLKKALGNAYKRGNRKETEKRIRLEALVTDRGAFVQISDEGQGFDVEETLRRFRAGETYFSHHGSGFRRYSKARSVISFADGGSTLRLRYLRAD